MHKNIQDNISYSNVEFLLLNYNSKDDLDDWVEKEMKKHMKDGSFVYLKTFEPKDWNVSHAKNIALKHASGDIICNVDADNFLGAGFASYVNDYFNTNSSIFLTGRTKGATVDAGGRVCMRKSDFLTVRGYDESILGYGYDDTDIYARLQNIGREEIDIDLKFLRLIPHNNLERLKNIGLLKNTEFILVHEGKTKYSAFIMNKNKKFEHLVIALGKDPQQTDEWSLDHRKSQAGDWERANNGIELKSHMLGSTSYISKLIKVQDKYLYKNTLYFKVEDEMKTKAFLAFIMIMNRSIYLKNKEKVTNTINDKGFGNAIIYKNFDYNKPI